MGGKRNQKKKKKKSWRAMLDGCFHKPTFDRKDSEDSKDSVDSKEVQQIGSRNPVVKADPQRYPAFPPARMSGGIEACPEMEGGAPIPVRGILKKSPSSSGNSGIFTESTASGLVYYNPIYTDVTSKGSSNPHEDNYSIAHGHFYHGAMPQQYSTGAGLPQQYSTGAEGLQQIYAGGLQHQQNRSNLVHASTLQNRFDGGRQIAESWEDWKAGYYSDSQAKGDYPSRGLLRHNLENHPHEGFYQNVPTHTNISTESRQQKISPQENRWSFPVSDRRLPNVPTTSVPRCYPFTYSNAIYGSIIPRSAAKENDTSSCRALVPYQGPQQTQRPYKSAFMQQQYQRQLEANSRFRPLSAPSSSLQDSSVIPSQNRTRHASENIPSVKSITIPTYKNPAQLVPGIAKDSETMNSNRSLSSTGSRIYDPIRKPMGSQFCPYSNPIYGLHSAVPAKDSAKRGTPHHQPQPAAHSNIYRRPFAEKEGTGYNVSHIYATVCRTESKSMASSCIYTSFSWQQKSHNEAVTALEPPPLPERFHPLMTAPPLPPPMMPLPLAVEPRRITLNADQPSEIARPPLPTYDEIIRLRNNKSRGSRPSSWCESDLKETERKREAFMKLLAQRYPQYADRIQGGTPVSGQTAGGPPSSGQTQGVVEKPARSRDPQRRRPGPSVIYDPRQATNTFEYDDLGTMSDLELPSFQRGGFMRTSLPIVRSASTSLERPLGLVFLVHGSQTKKSLLPNEVTTLDTVRALFVRAFPDLTMEMMEMARKKIYLLDPATSIYFQLEDLGDVKDRSVLKLHETDDEIPQKVRERQEIRGRTVQVPLSRSQSRPVGAVENPEYSNKALTLPPQASVYYSDGTHDPWNRDMERKSRSRTPEPMERPRSLSAGASSRQRYSHSPERFPTPDRGAGGGSLNPIPENRQVNPGYREPNYYETIGPHSPNSNYSRGGYPQSHYNSENPYAVHTAPPQQQAYIARSTRTSTMVHPQRAIGPTQAEIREGTRGANPTSRQPPAFAQGPMTQASEPIYQRSQSYHRAPTLEKDVEFTRSLSAKPANDHHTRNRIEKMEQQLASLTAWVHYQKSDLPGQRKESSGRPRSLGSTTSDSSDTFPASSASKQSEEISPPLSTLAPTNHVAHAKGLSDIPDGQRPPGGTSGTGSTSSTQSSVQVPAEISGQLCRLKSDLQVLRRQTQLNVEAMRDEFVRAASAIKAVISSVPGAENQVNFHKRVEATKTKTGYVSDKVQVDQELSDLESSVEELRNDVINHQCRVQLSDVEGMALLLSNITKNLADLKTQFPDVHEKMKTVMNNEMQTVVAEENFLKEEPSKIEKSLMRCKKLTGTLYTLKRLASVQDHRPPHIPNIASTQGGPEEDPKKTLLENIRALVPDHDRRVQEMKATEASRQRKKKISTQQEALKFGKSLEMVSKNLRPCSSNDDKGDQAGEGEREVKEHFKSESNGLQETPVFVSSHSSLSSKPSVSFSTQNTDVYSSTLPSSTPPVYSSTMSSSSSSSSASSSSSLSSVSLSSTTYTVSSNSRPVEIPPVSAGSSIKPLSSFAASLTTASKLSDKPTATVSAMTSTSTEIPRSVTSPHPHKPPRTDPPTSVKSATLPLTEMTERLTSNVQTGTGPVAHTVSTSTEMPKKSDASVSTPPITSEASSSTYRPPVFTKPQRLTSPNKNPKAAPLVEFESSSVTNKDRPKSSTIPSTSRAPPVTKANSVDLSPSKYYRPLPSTPSDANGHVNGMTDNKGEDEKLKPYRKAARSAFSSAWVSPPSSPISSSSKTNPPATSSSNSIAQITPGGTINLVLTGVASPKSPTSPGTFTITPPTDITTDAVSNPSPTTSMSKSPALTSGPPTTSKSDTETGGNKPKKVPPPPPPRKGSRPTSMTNLPSINGDDPEQEVPQFVGGILGQHRLSGGPLSSTPKAAPLQRALSTFEKDIASGIYANLNRPDLQNQNSTPQQILDKANTKGTAGTNNEAPAPLVSTTCVDRTERGSSSESTSSSNSGTSSMGSQQSVVNVTRSASVNMRGSNKPKPEPPKRHSSLLSKSPVAPLDTRVHSRRKTLNGVDL